MSPRNSAGFTLLEILVSLAIASVGIAAVAKYTASAAEVSYQTEERMVAVWAAGNRLAELRIGRAWPTPGSYQQQVEMGGRSWYLTETVSQTERPELRRVEVEVFTEPERQSREFSLQGYVALYVPPEEAVPEPEGGDEDPENGNGGEDDAQQDDEIPLPESGEQAAESAPDDGPPADDEDQDGEQ